MVVSERELLELPAEERRQLAAALLSTGCELEPTPVERRRRLWFLRFVGFSQAVLAGWILYLGASLPQTETISQWRTAWLGFDIALLGSFVVCGWAAWRGRQLLIPATLVTGTLLFCDAWFDTVLSWNTDERWWSVLSAAVVEVPLALAFWWVSRRMVQRTIGLARSRMGLPGTSPGLLHARLFDPMLPSRPRAEISDRLAG